VEIVYPPVGIAHITERVTDLIADRTATATRIRVATAMQPKAAPHFGTGIVVMSAFAVARLCQETFGLSTSVLLDMLDNAPAGGVTIGDVEYTTCLSHATDETGQSLAEVNTRPIRQLAEHAAQHAQVPFRFRTYTAIQAQPVFRDGLGQLLSRPEAFVPLFSPSEHKLRVRPVCPSCGMVDKTAGTIQVRREGTVNTLAFTCGRHGPQTARLDDPSAVFDANTPVRTVLRSLCFSHDRQEEATETIVLNGGDWAGEWMQRVYFDGLGKLGCTGLAVPFNLFTPQILDDSGAKLSKTIYLAGGRYADVPETWTSMAAYENTFGVAGLDLLWDEVNRWVHSPAKFFRNYTVRYLEHVLGNQAGHASPAERAESHALPVQADA
jgi:hypothetical protein